MEAKTAIILGVGALGLWWLSKRNDRATSNTSNNETNNLDDINTLQAQTFYNLLGVKRVTSGVFVATPVVLSDTKKKLAYLAENVADWSKIQTIFSKLCGNSYTITEALSTAIVNTTDRQTILNHISTALKLQALYAKIATTGYYSDGTTLTPLTNYSAGAYLGRAVTSKLSDNSYYQFINWQTGQRETVFKTHCNAKTLK